MRLSCMHDCWRAHLLALQLLSARRLLRRLSLMSMRLQVVLKLMPLGF